MTHSATPPVAVRFKTSDRGNVAVLFALVLPVLVSLVAGVTDYMLYTAQREQLQKSVDAATLGAAKELALADARRQNAPEVVKSLVEANITKINAAGSQPALDVQIKNEPLELSVSLRMSPKLAFGSRLGFNPGEIVVTATARIVGRPNICVLALDPSANGAISLEKNANVLGRNCSVFSNSDHVNSIKSKQSATLTAKLICAAGGKDGGKANFTPDPLTDCPRFDDPLAERPEPVEGACVSSVPGPVRVTSSTTLQPGTYCGGLVIEGGATEFAPGVYVIKGGEFRVRNGARVIGKGVGLFLTGAGAQFTFERQSSIDLSAPEAGPMAGLLFFESRGQPPSGLHQILSDDARNLLGTVYIPRGRLHVDAESPIADKSAYTAIVARMLTLYGGPTLVLNANYELTKVPVPAALRGVNQPAILVK